MEGTRQRLRKNVKINPEEVRARIKAAKVAAGVNALVFRGIQPRAEISDEVFAKAAELEAQTDAPE